MSLILKKRNIIKLSPVLWVAVFVMILILVFCTILMVNQDDQHALITDSAISTPEFSKNSGVYSSPFLLEIKAKPGFQIHYTTDGREPDEYSKQYSGAIEIDRSLSYPSITAVRTSPRWRAPQGQVETQMVIKAIGVKDGLKSEISTGHFIIKNTDLPVLSILTHPDSLFGFLKGIYIMGKRYEDKDNYAKDSVALNAPWWEYPANYHERGPDWERPVDFMYNDEAGNILSGQARIRIHGSATRGYAQKSLRFYFNDTCMKLPGTDICSGTLVLRNGGNDWDRAFIRDMLAQELFGKISAFARNGTPGVLYINGIYWGVHNFREYQDQHFIAARTGENYNNISIIDYDGTLYRGNQPAKWFRRVMKGTEEEIRQVMQDEIDIAGFIDYLIINMFLANTDWPHNNYRVWLGQNGRWNWLPTDFDYAMGFNGVSNALETDMLSLVYESNTVTGKLFRCLMQDKLLSARFYERFSSLLNNEFSASQTIPLADSLLALYRPVFQQQITRWNTHSDFDDWVRETGEVKAFLLARNEQQFEDLRLFFAKFAPLKP